ncbi:MAG: hypothetical protein ACFCUQ_17150, partial [Kiloniellales bacterium]
ASQDFFAAVRDGLNELGIAYTLNERLVRWHAEAAGYKIRYVPSTLPDLLKIEAVIDYEYRAQGSTVPQVHQGMAEMRLAYSRRPETDMEVCSSYQSVQEFARGEGIWRDLSAKVRREQLRWMIALTDELYPTFRWFLFNGLQDYCVPVTIFGPLRAAVYFGGMYFVFSSTEHLRAMTQQFDNLIRGAVVQPPEIGRFLGVLLEELEVDGVAQQLERAHDSRP